MLVAVHDQAVVDLVGKDHELVLAGDLDDALQNLLGVDGTRGVVGVDDHDGLGAAGDLGLHVGQVRVPLVLLVADVVDGVAAGQGDAGGPQRVVRAGDEHLVAVVDERVHGELDELGDAVAGVDVLHVHVGDVAQLGVLHDGLARGKETAGVRVALAVRELLAHVVDHLVGSPEAKRRRVANVELQDARAVLLHAGGLVHHGAADVVQDVVELVGLLELSHGDAPLVRFLLARSARGLGRCDLRRDVRGRDVVRHGVRGAHKPLGRDPKDAGKELHDVPSGRDLARNILADLALSKLGAALGGNAHEVDLLEAGTLHGPLESCLESLPCHRVLLP